MDRGILSVDKGMDLVLHYYTINTVTTGTDLTGMDMDMPMGTDMVICIHTRCIHIRVPSGYAIPMSNTNCAFDSDPMLTHSSV